MNRGAVLASSLASLAVALGALLLLIPNLQVSDSSLSLGSVVTGSEYNSNRFSSADAQATTTVLAKTGQGTLGSVVITVPATAGYLDLFNATSTTHSTSTAEALASFDSGSDVAGTYTFDSAFTSGLFVEVSQAFNGEYTITWR